MTSRDQEILQTLTHRVRVLSAAQVATAWWEGNQSSARRRLAILQCGGWITLTAALARPLTGAAPIAPAASWRPHDPLPDFGALSYRLQIRWAEPLQQTIIVSATKSAAARFAGWGGRQSRASELSHDLGLADVYLRLLRSSPKRAGGWLSEAALYARGEGRNGRLPDAMIVTRAEHTVIEFGGAYSKTKLREFHETCARRGWAYEIW